ncbi:AAA family ATPase [Nonomuraea guangzhouensis]|uniref:ATP/GTP-binding protein n=1 Tax=Nonomuraea guangzhouensis TaxID=1291555 RepID=A0ABW4G0L7_9ACTN|nr:ATP-binding protein [Nonomuraea guangzhouensis]
MLLSFRVSNHRSLRDEQQLLLTPTYGEDDPGDGWEAVPVAALFGANASGKSNVLDALAYMRNMVRGSLRESEPGTGISRHSFALDPAMRDEPSTYVTDILLGGIRYTYGFAVDDSQVVEEWMFSYPKKKKREIFHRRGDDYSIGDQSPASMHQVAAITESNVLFLSVAARSKQDLVRPVYDWFTEVIYRNPQILRFSRLSTLVESLERFGYLERMTSLLQAADTGIESAEIVEESDAELAQRSARIKGLGGHSPTRRKDVLFRHRGESGTFPLNLRDQSLGTQTLYDLGLGVFRSLDTGSVLIVDELDSSLHPYLTAQLVRLFRDQDVNIHGAQLIFSSHDATLLGRIQGEEVLQRDHVWFTEKNECGVTELFSLSDFKPRREDNRERRYLAGRYGAVPIVSDELFAAALAERREVDDVPSNS